VIYACLCLSWRRLRSGHSDIRLLFVTPEKVASSGNFQGLLRTLHADGRLARVVVDEAHCVSQVSASTQFTHVYS
jgi:superfamily II DNA helicase RecQ